MELPNLARTDRTSMVYCKLTELQRMDCMTCLSHCLSYAKDQFESYTMRTMNFAQVEKARLQFAKVAQACKNEAARLSEALKINENELEASEANLQSAETAYQVLEQERIAEQESIKNDQANEEDLEDERAVMAEALAESMQAMRPEKERLNLGNWPSGNRLVTDASNRSQISFIPLNTMLPTLSYLPISRL